MATVEEVASMVALGPPSSYYMTDSGAVMLISTNFTAALPLWASLGITMLGAAVGGLLMFVGFRIQTWMSPSESSKECEPLLPDSQGSTDCSSWPPDDGFGMAGPASSASKAEATVSWAVLITTAVMAVPSVLGTWCWPLLLAALFPAAGRSIESDSNREASHHFTFGADVVVFAFVIYYVARMASSPSSRSSFSRWGPLAVVTLACVLLILDPCRHILLDHGGIFFEEKTLAMYKGQGQLSDVGKFCQRASITGILLLLAGVMWHMRMPEALLNKLPGTEPTKAC